MWYKTMWNDELVNLSKADRIYINGDTIVADFFSGGNIEIRGNLEIKDSLTICLFCSEDDEEIQECFQKICEKLE